MVTVSKSGFHSAILRGGIVTKTNRQGKARPSLLAVNVAPMAKIDNDDKKLRLEDPVNNAITPHPAGMITLESALERLPLKWIEFQGIENMGHTPVKAHFEARHASQDGFRLTGQL